MSSPTLSIVVPLLNEEASVPALIEAVDRVLSGDAVELEWVLVDDGSTDATWSVVSGMSADDARVVGVRLSRRFGKESAICAGLDRVGGDAVIVMDADLQHPPEVLPRFLAAWRDGAEIVVGRKTERTGQGPVGRALSRAFNNVFTATTGVDMLGASDFRLLDRAVVDAWRRLPERNTFFRGMSTWVGFERVEIPFDVADRREGRSRWSTTGLLRLAIRSLTAYTSAPLHLVTLLGSAFLVFATILAVQTLVRYAMGEAVEGFTTVILLLLGIGGGQMVGLGIIGEYLARVHEEVKGRPRYIVADEVGTEPISRRRDPSR